MAALGADVAEEVSWSNELDHEEEKIWIINVFFFIRRYRSKRFLEAHICYMRSHRHVSLYRAFPVVLQDALHIHCKGQKCMESCNSFTYTQFIYSIRKTQVLNSESHFSL